MNKEQDIYINHTIRYPNFVMIDNKINYLFYQFCLLFYLLEQENSVLNLSDIFSLFQKQAVDSDTLIIDNQTGEIYS